MNLGLLVAEKNVDRHTRFMFYKYRYVCSVGLRCSISRHTISRESGNPDQDFPGMWKRHVSNVLNDYRGVLLFALKALLGGR